MSLISSEWVSILSKARKLANLAAPGSGATDGERDNARRMLAELCEREGISEDCISVDNRRPFGLDLVPDQRYRHYERGDHKPSRNAQRQLRDEAAFARRALKRCVEGFATKHRIFGPQSDEGDVDVDPGHLAAVIAVMEKARGKTWSNLLKLEGGK